MRLATAWALALAETRRSRGRLLFCVLSVALGVFALTSVRSISCSVHRNLDGQARQSMGADLQLSSNQPLNSEEAASLGQSLRELGARSVNSTRFYSMLSRVDADNGGPERATQLVRVRAVGDEFPLYGTIETEPPGLFENWSDEPQVIVDARILLALELRVGDAVRLGELTAVVAGQFHNSAGSPAADFSLAPYLYLHERHLPATELLQTGSRVNYERLFALPSGENPKGWVAAHAEQAEAARIRVNTAEESVSRLGRFLDRLSRFLTLVATCTLLLAAIGIGSALRALMQEKLVHAAILRCIGVTPRGVFVIYGCLALGVAGLGSLLGAGVGAVAPWLFEDALRAAAQGYLPDNLHLKPSLSAAWQGVAAGALATLTFSLLPLWRTAAVTPLYVLRRLPEGVAPRARQRAVIGGTLAVGAGVGLLLVMAERDTARLTLAIAAGLGVAAMALWGTSVILVRVARWLATRTASYAVRQGIANLHRPGNQTASVVVALGLAVLLLCTLLIAERSMQESIAVDKREDLPNLFIVDVQQEQLPETQQLLQEHGATQVSLSPMISTRISAINGKPVDTRRLEQESAQGPEAQQSRVRRLRTREFFATYREHPVASESVTRGRFWQGRPERQEASLDENFAQSLGVDLGDTLTLNIQGLPLMVVVTSFREIRWQQIRPNSRILLSPGEIEQAPKMYVGSARVEGTTARLTIARDLVARFPNLSVVDVTEMAKTITAIIERVSAVSRVLGLLAVVVGSVILVGAVASGRHARQREMMLLKVLGANQRTLRRILLTEHLVLAGLAALSGWLLAEVLNRWAWPTLFQVPARVPYLALGTLVGATVVLNAVLGLWIGRTVGARAPLELLRED